MPLSSVSCSSKQFRRIQHTRIQHYIECRFLPWQDFFSFRFFLVISSFLHFCTSPAYFRQGLWLVAALCIIGCCFKINTNYVKWHNWHNNVQCNKRTDRFYCLFFNTGHQPENHMVGNPIVYIKCDCVSSWAPVCGSGHILDQPLRLVSPNIQEGKAHIWSPSLCLHMQLESSRAEPVNTERKAETKHQHMHALYFYIPMFVFIIATDSLHQCLDSGFHCRSFLRDRAHSGILGTQKTPCREHP